MTKRTQAATIYRDRRLNKVRKLINSNYVTLRERIQEFDNALTTMALSSSTEVVMVSPESLYRNYTSSGPAN